MIPEMLILGALLGYILGKKNKDFFSDFKLEGLLFVIVGASVFLYTLRYATRPEQMESDFFLRNFGLIHGLSLLIMALGMFYKTPHPGKYLMGVGFGLNGLVVCANGFMPVSIPVLERLGQTYQMNLILENRTLTHGVMGDATRLNALGDWIYYNPPWALGKVMSVGDVLIALGIGIIAAAYVSYSMRRKNHDGMVQ